MPALVVLSLITLIGFALRVAGVNQSLYGDEMFTFVDTEHGLGELWHGLLHNEATPPLYFLLAWLSAQLGDATWLLRLPALAMGTIAVPLVYLLGAPTVGRRGALLGSALLAISPFAIFYSNEARAYTALMVLSILCTLSLLGALRTRRRRWWVFYSVFSCLVLYTHYTGIFLLLGQAAWALWAHRGRWRGVVLANAAAVLAYLPWLPAYVDQRGNALGALYLARSALPVSPASLGRGVVTALWGWPLAPLRELPGRPALAVVAAAVAVALAGLAVELVRRRRAWRDLGAQSPVTLLFVLAIGTPLGVLLYSAVSSNILVPRSFTASIPAMMLVIGWSFTRAARLPALAATAALLAAVAVGTIKTRDADLRRPPSRDAARFIDARARPGDPVVVFAPPATVLSRQLSINFVKPHDTFSAGVTDASAWKRGASGNHVFLVVPQTGLLRGIPRRSGPGQRFVLSGYRILAGAPPLGVFRYRLGAGGAHAP